MHIRARICIYIEQNWAKMWEVGLWGPQNVGSGTFKMLCHPPPQLTIKHFKRY